MKKIYGPLVMMAVLTFSSQSHAGRLNLICDFFINALGRSAVVKNHLPSLLESRFPNQFKIDGLKTIGEKARYIDFTGGSGFNLQTMVGHEFRGMIVDDQVRLDTILTVGDGQLSLHLKDYQKSLDEVIEEAVGATQAYMGDPSFAVTVKRERMSLSGGLSNPANSPNPDVEHITTDIMLEGTDAASRTYFVHELLEALKATPVS
jgi:hypothetical protein